MPLPGGRPIALIGLMGAGKSAVAVRLAAVLGAGAVDLDQRIEEVAGRTIREVFEQDGEAAFRARERAALATVLDQGATVIACGGGIVVDSRTRDELRRRCHVVWLEVSPREASGRLIGLTAGRPLLTTAVPIERLQTLLAEREGHYATAAHARVQTDGLSPDQVARAVIATLGVA